MSDAQDSLTSLIALQGQLEFLIIHFGHIALEFKRLGPEYDTELRCICEIHDGVVRAHKRLTKIVTDARNLDSE